MRSSGPAAFLRTAAIATCLSAFLAGPALAGKLVDAAPDAMRDYAEQAGYMVASIPKCGGDAEEVVYFKDIARDNLVQIGADEDDLGFLDFHMEQAAETAEPKNKDCSEDGGVPIASELFRLRSAIEAALR